MTDLNARLMRDRSDVRVLAALLAPLLDHPRPVEKALEEASVIVMSLYAAGWALERFPVGAEPCGNAGCGHPARDHDSTGCECGCLWDGQHRLARPPEDAILAACREAVVDSTNGLIVAFRRFCIERFATTPTADDFRAILLAARPEEPPEGGEPHRNEPCGCSEARLVVGCACRCHRKRQER